MTTFAVMSLGCKVNAYESSSVLQGLKEKGYQEVDFKQEADVYVIFTCAVTNTAASKSRQKIHQAIKQNPNAIICVVGCYVQVEVETLKENQDIDILIGSSHKRDLVQLVEECLAKRQRVELVEDVRNQSVDFEAMSLSAFEHQTRAYLKIQDGCNQFCSYCIIPYARGRERSLSHEEALCLAGDLAKHHREIVLTGIHTGRYGQEKNDLVRLLKEMAKIDGLDRIRLSSIEITEITDELIDFMVEEPKLARHLHIPLQSGCDAVLKRMNRPYTTEQFLTRVKQIRQRLPHISISTDLIVGFVAESEEEFVQTVDFLNQVEFSFIHVFPFSSKTHTVASTMKGHLSHQVKKERAKKCLELSEKGYNKYKESWNGQQVEVLVETSEKGVSKGHTSEYIPIELIGSYPSGSLVRCSFQKTGETCVGKE